MLDSYRNILYKTFNNEIQLNLYNILDDKIKELSELDTLKLSIISRIDDLYIMIGRVNEIIKYNYYAYKLPLNCGINDESLIFKLDTIQLFIIMILQDRIMKDEKLKYKKDYQYLINIFINFEFKKLDFIIPQLKDDLIKDFFIDTNEKRSKLLSNFESLHTTLKSIKEQNLIRNFIFLNEEILEILVLFKFNLALIIDKLNELNLTEKFFSILNTEDLRLIKYILLNSNNDQHRQQEEIIYEVRTISLPEKRMILDEYEEQEDIKTKKPKLI